MTSGIAQTLPAAEMHLPELGKRLRGQAMRLGDDLRPFPGSQKVARINRRQLFILQQFPEAFHLLDSGGRYVHIGVAVVHARLYHFPVTGQVKSGRSGSMPNPFNPGQSEF